MNVRSMELLHQASNLGIFSRVRLVQRESFVVYCSQCGGQFNRDNPNGFSHCEHHSHLTNMDD